MMKSKIMSTNDTDCEEKVVFSRLMWENDVTEFMQREASFGGKID